MAESYLVPAGYGEGRYEDRKSKFIGDLYFVESQEQAIELLNEVKAKYRDARHHCYAYIIREGNYMRYSDDGEPAKSRRARRACRCWMFCAERI